VPALDQKRILTTLIAHLGGRFLTNMAHNDRSPTKTISAVAGLLARATGDSAPRRACLVAWLTGSTGAGVGEGIAVRRAVVAALSASKDDICSVVEAAVGLFGDELYIRHSPALQQEGGPMPCRRFPLVAQG
jgi:telomere length regulation protein